MQRTFPDPSRFFWALVIAGLLAIVWLSSTGCATRSYVDRSVRAVQWQIDNLPERTVYVHPRTPGQCTVGKAASLKTRGWTVTPPESRGVK